MSKPKPGLGKGIVRTLSHAHPSSSTPSAGHHGALGHREYHTASRSVEGRKEYTAGTWRESSASFSTIGLPHASAASSSSSSWLPSGSIDEIVLPFRPSGLGRKPRPSARALFSTTSTSSSPSISLPMNPASLPQLWGLNFSSLSSYLSLPSLTAKVNAAFSEFGFGDPGQGGNLPSPYIPGARPPRGTDPHFALSPNDTPSSAPASDPTFYPAFGTLGLPYPQSMEPLYLAPLGMEGSALNLYTSNLIFHLGASGLAKERPVYHGRPRPQSAPPPPRPRSFPLPEVTPPLAADIRSTSVGEDAYFARIDGMCIADGVGGWARSGRGEADAGRWSRLLTHFCEMEVVDWWAGKGDYALKASPATLSSEEEIGRRMEAGLADEGPSGWASKAWKRSSAQGSEARVEEAKRRPLDPVEIMQRGYEKCLSCVLAEGIHGSSTCLLALLHHSTLLVANLGDCCLLLIRGGQIVLRTDEMQHAFNFPLQLGTHSRDEPMKDAKRYDISVRKGDVVVVGSDGLMDNLFDEDILDTLAQFAPPTSQPYPTPPSSRPTTPGGLSPFSPQKVSEALCKRARAVSEQTSSMTPFMVKAIEEGIDFVGGKKDDISVLVGVIGDRDDSGPNPGLALHTE